jgi:dTDP-4-amino-4,6-dideoxygalactose transaminase
MIYTFSPTIRRKEMDAVLSCMVDEKIGPGDISRQLTETAAEFFHMEGAVALRSPLKALELALLAPGIEPGSAVMLSALAPAWQYEGVLRAGFQPLVLDVGTDSVVPDAGHAAKGIEEGGRLLVLQEALGHVGDYNALQDLGVPILQDATQSVGASEGGHPDDVRATAPGRSISACAAIGAIGYYTLIGLEERDCITAGGGALLLAKSKRDWSALRASAANLLAVDLMPDINNALALVQLKEFRRNEERRQEMREKYVAALLQGRHRTIASVDVCESKLEATTVAREGITAGTYGFPVLLERGFKEVKHYAARKGIDVAPAFAGSIVDRYDSIPAECPNAHSVAQRCALFPLYPLLSTANVADILKVLSTLP